MEFSEGDVYTEIHRGVGVEGYAFFRELAQGMIHAEEDVEVSVVEVEHPAE